VPKFIAIGTHPPVAPEEFAQRQGDVDREQLIARIMENTNWYNEQLANGTFEQVYVMEGAQRGRLVIADAGSEESLLGILQSTPGGDHPLREWKINRLSDFQAVTDEFIKGLPA
jgi:hypothetical protein